MLYKSLHTIVRLFTLSIFLTMGASPARAGDATLPEWDFHFPMDLPTFVSGSFGELRANHFHSGVDFTTGGKTGLPLYAIDEGYVARIGVSPVGFGKAIYIAHPNGYTSVYAHCDWFSKDIEEVVQTLQYQKESFAIDESFAPGQLPVSRGQVIAYSGNSGSSGGPHLHFEIRETATQKPINVHHFGLPVEDDVPPHIEAIVLYPLDEQSHINGSREPLYLPATFHSGQFHLRGNPQLTASGTIGVGIETIDYFSHSWRRCGVYSVELRVDNVPWFRSQIDGFLFAQTRYLNSHIDYALRRQQRKVVQKSFLDPNNTLPFYTTTPEKGRIRMEGGQTRQLSYEVRDATGNSSRLTFQVNGAAAKTSPKTNPAPQLLKINPFQPYFISIDHFKAEFEAQTFYTEVPALFDLQDNPGLGIGAHFSVLSEDIPAQRFFTLTLPLPKEYQKSQRICAARVVNGKLVYAGGQIQDGHLVLRTREPGTYCLSTDTTPPEVRLLSLPAGRNYSRSDRIRIAIKDDFSGIASYRATINGQWALFEYDAKNNVLNGWFRSLRLAQGQRHQLELVVTDQLGNQTNFSTEFLY